MKLISSKFFLAILVVACAVQVSNGQFLGGLIGGIVDLLGNLLGNLLGGLLGVVSALLKSLLGTREGNVLNELTPLVKAHLTVVDKLAVIIKNMTTAKTTDADLNNLGSGIVLSALAVNKSIDNYFTYIIMQTPNTTTSSAANRCRFLLTKAVADYNSNIFVTNVNLTYVTLVPKLKNDIAKQGSCVPVQDVCSTTCTIVYDIPYDFEDVDKYASGFPAVAYEGYSNLNVTVKLWVDCLKA